MHIFKILFCLLYFFIALFDCIINDLFLTNIILSKKIFVIIKKNGLIIYYFDNEFIHNI